MKVKAGSLYLYQPVPIDRLAPPVGVAQGTLGAGDLVRVVNMHGCPPANTMGHCHIACPADGSFLGLVCTASLSKPEV